MAINLKFNAGFRLAIIAALSLLLLIPTFIIMSVIDERQARRDEATREISNKWGASQTITGPILSVTFKRNNVREYAHFLPETLRVDGSLNPEVRKRGIYQAVLYGSELKVSGEFSSLAIDELNIAPDSVFWDEAVLHLGITDLKGIKESVKIKWSNQTVLANPGIVARDVMLSSGINAKVKIKKGEAYQFSFTLNLNGSSEIFFMPVGKETEVNLKSDWNNPSFNGDFLPDSREVNSDGFKAKWKILHLNRNFPQQWIGNVAYLSQNNTTVDQSYSSDSKLYSRTMEGFQTSSFGVRLRETVDDYQKITRTVKYAIMFIGLTFLAFFVIEIFNRKRIHPIQYLLVGLALVIFYTLLLSISEQLNFTGAYAISATATIVLITIYMLYVLESTRVALFIGGLLTILYGLLFLILQLQDYALLFGSLLLFAVLAAIMFITRKIDWYALSLEQEKTEK